jgi:crotonobetainyl-CoA:carnitine CoA-transferase CaiB-like acyl-CoA transferase
LSAFGELQILDFSTGIAGPYAAMFFADHGADVVKVEPPGGDPYRAEPGFQTLNRGKRSCVVDLRDDGGRSAAFHLAGGADAVIVDLPQGQARELGIDYETLRSANAALMYLAMPPYGERGPLVDRLASPGLLHAANGMTEGQESYSGDPVSLVLPIAEYGTAALGATALAAGLRARARWGIGQMLEVSGLAGSLALQLGAQVETEAIPPKTKQPSANGGKGPLPAYRLHQGSDGKWFYLGCISAEFYHKLLIAIDRTDLLTDERLGDTPLGQNTPEAQALLTPLFESLFLTQPRDHWVEFFRASDVPAQPVQTRDEFFESELVSRNQMRVAVQHPELGEVEMMGVPLVLEAAPGEVRGPAPLLGEHTHEVMAEHRAGVIPTPASHEAPGPHVLSGVRVLDLTQFIAGPVSGRQLAMLGADVIKVEPPHGEPFRVSGLGFLGWNQGKRSITLDLRTDAGREVLHRLVATVDVVLESFRPGVSDRLGVDFQTLRRINPRLIYVMQPGFGDDETMRDVPIFDPLVQSLAGAVDAQGGDGEPVRYTVAVTDQMHGLVAAFATCTALAMRERTGEGQRVRTSLVRTGLAYQAAEFTRYGSVTSLRGGRDFAGPSAGQRWYRCSDSRYLWVEATDDEQRLALIAATGADLGVSDCAQPADGSAAVALAEAFASRPVEQWIAALDAAGVPCNAIVPRHEVLSHPATIANELVVTEQHGPWGETVNVGALIHASETRVKIQRRAPLLSEHARELLAELGYDASSMAALAQAGVLLLDPLT